MNPYRENNQTVKVIKNVLSKKSGIVSFMRKSDIVDMEGHIASVEDYYPDRQMDGDFIQVASLTVRQFTAKYNVPKYFGVLSIDAEGSGNQVVLFFLVQDVLILWSFIFFIATDMVNFAMIIYIISKSLEILTCFPPK